MAAEVAVALFVEGACPTPVGKREEATRENKSENREYPASGSPPRDYPIKTEESR